MKQILLVLLTVTSVWADTGIIQDTKINVDFGYYQFKNQEVSLMVSPEKPLLQKINCASDYNSVCKALDPAFNEALEVECQNEKVSATDKAAWRRLKRQIERYFRRGDPSEEQPRQLSEVPESYIRNVVILPRAISLQELVECLKEGV